MIRPCFSLTFANLILYLSVLTATVLSPAYGKLITVTVSQEDNFRNLISSGIETTVDQIPGDEVYIDSAGGNFQTQYEQVKSYVDVGADAIIILSDGNEEQNKKFFEFAKKVPLIFINAEPVSDLSSMPPNTLYVGSNEVDSGTMQMEELARQANYRGKVALLIGEATHPAAVTRTQDVKDVMSKYPDMELVVSKAANWQRNQAYKVVTDWLKQNIEFDILVANNDEMILGAIMALKDAGRDPNSVLTGGIDATPDALRSVASGELNVTVLQDALGQAKSAVEASYQMMANQHVPSPHWVPFRLVTSDNYEQFLKD
ncbi:rhizopine-binding protein [Vibrio albus]|uniref:Autoinducer 2-binding periplasmic protein LuxP n=1 Tax=Vibrio albus TaxID=2200953 RepID=A0A2U3B949_9VIBR|nr:substrate-binding domain-containing protein [Vibrio albus]PWI33308.1 rhizopine-binding protein [Vibrio albus]